MKSPPQYNTIPAVSQTVADHFKVPSGHCCVHFVISNLHAFFYRTQKQIFWKMLVSGKCWCPLTCVGVSGDQRVFGSSKYTL